jgi:hypothetical protein
MDEEIWLPIPEYKGIYEVSNMGRIRSLDRITVCSIGRHMRFKGRILKARSVKPTGYLMVNLSKNNKNEDLLVHRLVAQAFIPNPSKFPIVNHKDCDKSNSRANNLEWCTESENTLHALANNRRKTSKGASRWNATLTDEIVKAIRERFLKGERQAQISRQFKISRQQVSRVVNNKAWKD